MGVSELDLLAHYIDGLNTYQAVKSEPVGHSDPLGLFVDFFVPGPGDMITGALESLVTDYAANLDCDVEWALDWTMDDDAHTRLNSSWVYESMMWGVYDSFDVFGYNPLDTASELMDVRKKYESGDPNAPSYKKIKSKYKGGRGPYSYLKDPQGVGPNKDFYRTQKRAVLAENWALNGGRIRSDVTGRFLPRASGLPSSPEVDHTLPKSKGGTNSYSNAQVVERHWNRGKRDSIP